MSTKKSEIKKNNIKLAKRYLSLRSGNITDKSKDAMKGDLILFLRFINEKHIEEVDYKDIDAFLEYCREERKNGNSALGRKYNTLKAFYDTMIKKEYLEMKNPTDKVDKIKSKHKVRNHVTLNEYKQIISFLEEKEDLKGLALFSLLFSSAIRVGEVHRLNILDLDFENREFIILGKGDKERVCIFSEEAKKYLLQYINSRDDDFEYLFVSREHNRWSISSIQQYVKSAAKSAGIEKNIHPHLVRHGTAMLLLDKGMQLDEIQKVLGHSNIGTTQIYAKTSMKRVKSNVDSIYNNL